MSITLEPTSILSIRLSELTKTTISRNPCGDPKHLLVRLTDPELFGCPFVIMTEVGAASISSEESKQPSADFLDRFWASNEGATSERGADSAEVHTRAILDRHGRIMVLMTHNTDLGDSLEREADDPQYFYQMSVRGYAFGINALLYAMTH